MLKKARPANIINHIVFVVDRSYSMKNRAADTIRVFDSQIKNLAEDSKRFKQETRVTVILFGSLIECVIYDMDVLRLPSLADLYEIESNTKLRDATILAINDLKMTPTKYGDHSFLIYVLTDGQENESRASVYELKSLIDSLDDNWTFAAFVPNRNHIGPMSREGFPVDNIAVWSTTSSTGIQDVGDNIRKTTQSYMQNRSVGIRGSKSLFVGIDASRISTAKVVNNLTKLSPNDYEVLHVTRRDDKEEIRTFIEARLSVDYNRRDGRAYYQLTKPEIIQATKKICVRDKTTRDVYTGVYARQLLGLPAERAKVSLTAFGKYDIFVSSTSVNRHLVAGTDVLYVY